MSRIIIELSQIDKLKNIIKTLQPENTIHLIKTNEKYKRELLKHTILCRDIINIICSYNDEMIELKIETVMIETTLHIRFIFKDIVDLRFHYNDQTCHIYNIMSNIINYSTYTIYHNEIDVDIKTLSVSHKKKSYNNWIYPLIIKYSFGQKCPYYAADHFKLVNILHFFNTYMKHYYKKQNYFHIKDHISCNMTDKNTFVNIITTNIFNAYCCMYPLDHKKVKNIIVITKVLKKQIDKIIKRN